MGIKYRTVQEAINSIKSGQRVFMQGSAATPSILLKSLFERKGELKNVELVSISTLGNVVFNSKS
jgi:acyl-CoA hydrolase